MANNLLSAAVSALLLTGSALAALEDTGLDSQNVTFAASSSRFVVEFSESGSAKFRKRDGSAVRTCHNLRFFAPSE